MTTASQIVSNTALWPANTVWYSQSGAASPTRHRPDCSGYASMCLGLPTPGENTVSLLTMGIVRPITWAELAPGDVVGRLGIGTGGDLGHVMVVTGVDHAGGTYDVMEQGGGYGPDRNTYDIGDGQGRAFLPYRLSTLEDDMADIETIMWVTSGVAADGSGYLDPNKVPNGPQRWAAAQAVQHNIRAVQEQITALAGTIKAAGAGGGVDVDVLADKVVARLGDTIAEQVAEKLAARLAQ